jgi:hypothetical protein
MGTDDGHGIPGGEWKSSSDQPVEYDAQRIEIGASIHLAPGKHFGRGIVERATAVRWFLLVEKVDEAEIHQLRDDLGILPPLGSWQQHDILGLDVVVEQAAGVNVIQSPAGVPGTS